MTDPISQVTIKRLTPTHMIVALSDTLSGIVFPSHYSDVFLKHPEKKFVAGSVHKARVSCSKPIFRRKVSYSNSSPDRFTM